MWNFNRSGSFNKIQTPYHSDKKCYRGRSKSADRCKMKWTKRGRRREGGDAEKELMQMEKLEKVEGDWMLICF